jgi:hypothetical protein
VRGTGLATMTESRRGQREEDRYLTLVCLSRQWCRYVKETRETTIVRSRGGRSRYYFRVHAPPTWAACSRNATHVRRGARWFSPATDLSPPSGCGARNTERLDREVSAPGVLLPPPRAPTTRAHSHFESRSHAACVQRRGCALVGRAATADSNAGVG